MTSLSNNPTRLFALAATVSLAAIVAALVTQHVFGMEPCAWCVLQRLIFLCIAGVALLGMLWRKPLGQMASAVLMDVLAGAGVAAALWQHLVASGSTSCNLTLADRIVSGTGLDGLLPEIFAPRASCAEAAVKLLAVPYEFWSLTLFAMLGAMAVLVILSQVRHGR